MAIQTGPKSRSGGKTSIYSINYMVRHRLYHLSQGIHKCSPYTTHRLEVSIANREIGSNRSDLHITVQEQKSVGIARDICSQLPEKV